MGGVVTQSSSVRESELSPPRLRTRERRARVLELLDGKEFVSVKELADEFGLTEMSVRRDLSAMVAEGLITRVRGGAGRPAHTPTSRQYAEAAQRNAEAKFKIARRAATLLDHASVVFFYSGSTVARVAASLDASAQTSLTVVTNSLPIIDDVSAWGDPHLVAVGGLYLPAYMAFVGPQAVAAFEGVSADVAVLGCDGLSADGGLTTPHQLVAEVGATIVRRATRKVVVADSSKVGRRGFTPIAPIEDIDVLVTDDGADPTEVARLRDTGLEVIVV
ncbi:DeoR/GlpR transcriptional regulator [Microbispora cellulosiformans]|uniref:DeoR/GlpR transcriptional regulator n=1 Tax=Microbispora cellulosiformans TaxID=2614688 RepID=A0A5J5JXN4_9ACTN|nr:DeoR/GlpR transcriptional regulator [Microbispora cellulosiformans]